MKKRFVSIILISCMAFASLSACGNNQNEIGSTEEVVEEINEVDEGKEDKEVSEDIKEQKEDSSSENYSKSPELIPVMVTDKYDSISGDESDDYFGYAYMTVDGLVILGDGYDELKASLQKANEDAWKEAEQYKTYIEEFLEDMNYEKVGTMPWEFNTGIYIERADANVLSYMTEGYSFYGGAHPNMIMKGYNFDSKTGAEISLDDLVHDKDALLDVLISDIEQREIAKEGMMDSDWKDTIASYIKGDAKESEEESGFSFVIEKNRIHFIFDTYTLGAYALGPVEAYLENEAYEKLVEDNYKTEYTYLCDEINEYGEYCKEYKYDFDQDGKDELIQIASYPVDEYGCVDVVVSYGRDEDSLIKKRIDHTYDASSPYVMENEEGEYYLYVEVARENDWKSVEIFDLNNPEKGPVEIENKYGNAFYEFIPVDSKHIFVEDRIYMMGTYSGYREAYVDEDGQLKPYDNMYQIISFNHETAFDKNAEYPTSTKERFYLTALQDFEALESSDISDFTTGEPVTIKEGDKCYPYATDGENYMIFMLEDGGFIKLEYEPMGEDDWEHKINGIPEGELFEGIIYAG